MTLQADVLVDRRRLKRRLSLWRLVAAALILLLIGAVMLRFDGGVPAGWAPAQIARVSITGLIRDKRKQLELLDKLAKMRHVKAVILRISSPGGTTSGGEALFEAIGRVAEKKPVVAVLGSVATSAAYMAAMASDRIVARANTITGSIGVIMQWAEVSKMLKSLGIQVEAVRSGPLKAKPSFLEPADEAGRRLAAEMVAESQKWFLGLVAERRAIDPSAVPGLKDGRIFSGRQALRHKLVDEIGGETKAVSWLAEKRGIAPDLAIVDWKAESEGWFGILSGMAGWLAHAVGLPSSLVEAVASQLPTIRSVQLDGLVSLWHPQGRLDE